MNAGAAETILLVEDKKAVRAYTKAALEEFGYRVLEAIDGDEAISLAARFHGAIDLVITDLMLPGMNGWRVSERLIASQPDLRVIFTSGHPPEMQALLSSNMHFLQKPYGPDELEQMVRQALGKI